MWVGPAKPEINATEVSPFAANEGPMPENMRLTLSEPHRRAEEENYRIYLKPAEEHRDGENDF